MHSALHAEIVVYQAVHIFFREVAIQHLKDISDIHFLNHVSHDTCCLFPSEFTYIVLQ